MALFFPMVLFFPMLPQWLPPGHSVQSPPRSGNFSAQTSASFHPSCSAAMAPLSLCCTGSLTLCCTGAPAGNTSWAPQALRCTGAPCRQHLMGASSSALYLRPLTLCCTGSLTLRCTGSLTLRCTGAPAGRQPHLAEKNSGLASNLAHLGRIC